MTALLEAKDVSFAYDGAPVLEGVDLRVGAGEFVALVGPNGSGKTTLLKILLGLLSSSGSVRLLGRDPADLAERWRVGYVPQRPALGAEQVASVEEVVAAGRLVRTGWWRRPSAADEEAVTHALDSVALGELRRRPVADLSVGQQQRVSIARAFAAEPDLLVLDEPIAGVDAESQRRFRESLRHLIEEHRSGILLVSHELGPVAEDIDRVAVLKRTIVFDGSPSELVAAGVSLGVHHEDLPLWLEGLR
ncbi:MAG TPA: metal ABC transporter ATP-binding protein [Actinomycetota bacterium]|nr:metal ABC transporter ATP-binding protein [Actinomycetota bacterium]